MNKDKAHDSRAIANHFVYRAIGDGRALSVMKLLKLVFFAHGWHFGYHGAPLVCHDALAWQHGPVFREVYGAFRLQGMEVKSLALADRGYAHVAALSPDEEESVDIVHQVYSPLSGPKLSGITHEEGSPWQITWNLHPYGRIPDELIRLYYEEQVRQIQGNKERAQ